MKWYQIDCRFGCECECAEVEKVIVTFVVVESLVSKGEEARIEFCRFDAVSLRYEGVRVKELDASAVS